MRYSPSIFIQWDIVLVFFIQWDIVIVFFVHGDIILVLFIHGDIVLVFFIHGYIYNPIPSIFVQGDWRNSLLLFPHKFIILFTSQYLHWRVDYLTPTTLDNTKILTELLAPGLKSWICVENYDLTVEFNILRSWLNLRIEFWGENLRFDKAWNEKGGFNTLQNSNWW